MYRLPVRGVRHALRNGAFEDAPAAGDRPVLPAENTTFISVSGCPGRPSIRRIGRRHRRQRTAGRHRPTRGAANVRRPRGSLRRNSAAGESQRDGTRDRTPRSGREASARPRSGRNRRSDPPPSAPSRRFETDARGVALHSYTCNVRILCFESRETRCFLGEGSFERSSLPRAPTRLREAERD